jgi:UDP-glucuronate 4-epimerase
LSAVFKKYKIKKVVNLAAQAGVRYSMENPLAYINSNIVGFAHVLECCRHYNVEHLVYASTSSVYGANTKMPFSEHDSANHPLSVYAASKKSNELMAHTYSYLYQLPTTGLRFFTVYGPWGRPDMALFKFTKAILEGKPIDVFNHGKHTRDFTYIDDIVNGIIKTLDNSADSNLDWNSSEPDPASSKAPWRIYNIGNNKSIQLMDYIHALEKALGKKAIINFLPLQPGDVPDTFANVDNLQKKFNYKPSTPVGEGITNFVEWYKNYYRI